MKYKKTNGMQGNRKAFENEKERKEELRIRIIFLVILVIFGIFYVYTSLGKTQESPEAGRVIEAYQMQNEGRLV